MTVRKWVSELTPAAFLIGACFVVPGAGVALSIVSGVAVNVASRPAEQAAGWATRRLSGNTKHDINHDLENAMKRGYVRAVNFLGDVWKKSYQPNSTTSLNPDPAELFTWLCDEVDEFLSERRLKAFLDNAETIQSFGQPKQVENFLEPYLYGRTDEVGTFLKQQLVPTIALFFGEELKSDTRAWRAYQRVVADSTLAGFQRIESTQDQQHRETIAKLEALIQRFDAVSPDIRLDEGFAELKLAVDRQRTEVMNAIETDGRLTRDAIEYAKAYIESLLVEQHAKVMGTLDEIRRDIRQLVIREGDAPSPISTDKILWFGDRRRNSHFVGREHDLEWIEQTIAGIESGVGAAVVLHALGGTGKTQLALEYAHRHQDRYAGIWWMLADSESSLVAGYSDLAKRLNLPASRTGDPRLAAEAARRYLEGRGSQDRWLLVLDNVNEVDVVDGWIPDRGVVDVLVTSWVGKWDGDRFFHPRKVELLSLDEAIELLMRRTEDRDRDSAKALAEDLGRLPLALEQAAAFVNEQRETRSLALYLDLYRSNPGGALARHRPKTGNYPETVGTTWKISMSAVEEEVPAARDLMNLLSFFAPDAIPLDLIIAASDLLPEDLGAALRDPELGIISMLNQYSLISLGPSGDIFIHRLVQTVTRHELALDAQSHWSERALHLVLDIFPGNAHEYEYWSTAGRTLTHATQVLQHAERSNDADAERAELSARVGSFLHSQGGLAEARALHEEALALRRRVLPAEHPDIGTSLNNLAGVMESQGELAGAREKYEEALTLLRRVLPAEHPAIATSLNNLAGLLFRQGDLAGVVAMLGEALAFLQRVLPAGHPHITIMRENLEYVNNRILKDEVDVPNSVE
jgi:tetratricopeptide (TPR) repeat protein